MTNNFLTGEALRVFKHKYQETQNKPMTNYDLVIQVLMNHFFHTKSLKIHKRYLYWVLFISHKFNINELIFRTNDIINDLNQFPPLMMSQGFTNDKIIKFIAFVIPHKWHKHIFDQGFYLSTKSLNNLVEFYK